MLTNVTIAEDMDCLHHITQSSVSPFHCIETLTTCLNQNDFSALTFDKDWSCLVGGKFYVNLFGSTLIAFHVGSKVTKDTTLKILTSHTDWPTFLVKPDAQILDHGYLKLNTEPYGGALYHTFMDHPLGIAGRVCTKGKDAFHPDVHLFDSKGSIVTIPNLAAHMNRDANNGYKLNAQTDMLPIFMKAPNDSKNIDNFLSYLAEQLSVSTEDLLDYQLNLYSVEDGCYTGINKEFYLSPRIDNNSSVSACLDAILKSEPADDEICISIFYDNEEIGNATKQGAAGNATEQFLSRLLKSLDIKEEYLASILFRSLCLSLDVAHAVHPNHAEKCDLTNQITLGDGLAIKYSSRQSYATDAYYTSMVVHLCEQHNIPYKRFLNRSDIRGGSTLGSTFSAKLSIPTVDIGIPLLAMHSVRELMAPSDQHALCTLARVFFQN